MNHTFTISSPRARLFSLYASKLLQEGKLTPETYKEAVEAFKAQYSLSDDEYTQRTSLN